MTAPADRFGPPEVGIASWDYAHAWKLVDRWLGWVERAYGADYYRMNRNEHWVRLPHNGAKLWVFSGEKDESVPGNTLSDLFVDEAQFVSDAWWNKARPSLNVRTGRVVATGTPDIAADQQWFRGMFERGQLASEPNYHSATVSGLESEWITTEEIADARRSMTTEEFRMLILGQWLPSAGQVFTDYEHIFDGEKAPYDATKHYAMSLDVALDEDFCVAYVYDRGSNRVVNDLRVSRLSYTELEPKVVQLYKDYRCQHVIMDATGMGKPMVSTFTKAGLVVIPYIFSHKSKTELIANAQRMVEHKRLHFPKGDDQLRREMSVYAKRVTQAGNVTFSAPSGFFDDKVIAMSLMAWDQRNSWTRTKSHRYVTFGRS
jgi:hypothetical protein